MKVCKNIYNLLNLSKRLQDERDNKIKKGETIADKFLDQIKKQQELLGKYTIAVEYMHKHVQELANEIIEPNGLYTIFDKYL